MKDTCGMTPDIAMLVIDPPPHSADVIGTQNAISSVNLKQFSERISEIAHLFLYTCKSKMVSNSNANLSGSEIDCGDDGYPEGI